MSGLFNTCKKLVSVGNITYDENNVAGEVNLNSIFNMCPLLETIGGITLLNQNGNKSLNGTFSRCARLTGDIDLSKIKDVTDLGGVTQECKALNSVKLPTDLSKVTSMKASFFNSIINEVDLGSLSLATSLTTLQDICNNATITNLKGFNAIPNTVTALTTSFRGANINNGNFVFPNFTSGSSCEHLGGAFDQGSNVQLPSIFTIPAPMKYLESMCTNNKNMPRTLVLDCSNVTDLLGNQKVFQNCKGLEEITWKLPQHIWSGGANKTSYQSSLYFLYDSSAKKITLDYTAYKGNCIGTDGFLPATDNLELYGIDFNLTGHVAMGDSPKYIKAFTVHGACNIRDIDLRAWRMSYENYLKFVNEAIATLDCANLGDFIKLELGTLDAKGNPIDDNNAYRTKDYLSVKSPKTLKIQITLQGLGERPIIFYDKDKNYLSSISFSAGAISQGREFDVPPKASYLKIANINYNEKMETTLTYKNPEDTPKTLTMRSYTNYAGTAVLTAEQKETIISKATPKGWNVVFV